MNRLSAAFVIVTCVLGVVAPAGAAEIEVINLYDAFGAGKKGTTKHFGFSALVRYRGKSILFDTGADAGIFERNLAALRIDPKKIDAVVLSHNHHDHISGLDYLLQVNPGIAVYLPRDFTLGASVTIPVGGSPQEGKALPTRQRYFDGKAQKLEVSTSGRFRGARVTWIDRHQSIGPGIDIVFTRSKLMGRFVAYPPHGNKPKLIGMPELSLSLRTRSGDVLMVGCSHSSVEAIVREALAASKRRIALVAGGYHLIPYSKPDIEGLARRLLQQYKVKQLAPCHCTGHRAFGVLRRAYGKNYRFFGLGSVLKL